MKNKQVAQIAMWTLIITFFGGFFSAFGIVPYPLVLLLSFINIGTQCWCIGRLWSSREL